MRKLLTKPLFHTALAAAAVGGALAWTGQVNRLEASSHREAPLIADDPLADNTDVYAFRDPTDPEMINIIANFIPFQLPQGGPNYYHFGENIRYEIHIKNDATTTGDDITYRFTFTRTNEDPTTHFNIRLGKENLKTTYKLEMSTRGGAFTTVMDNAVVPPYNVGPRAISGAAGLGAASYDALMTSAITTAGGGKVFCGPVDDPFFVDIGGIEDLGGVRPLNARDGLYHKNVNTIALQLPISVLQKTGKPGSEAANILDPNYVIGVWASASRPAIKTLVAPTATTPGSQTVSGEYVQVSRLGMPLTNEVVNPIGNKDEFNARTPYTENAAFQANFVNPELGLYMADNTPRNGAAAKPAGQTYYGEAVPGFAPLRIQSKSLAGRAGLPTNGFDFRNGADGLAVLSAEQRAGTVFADATFGPILLQTGKPRSADLLPIFMTGVPNLRPYQLATGKAGNPLAAGKPFINNFLPVVGDMLRLNMAVPPTPRNSTDFSSEGLIAAARLGLTDPRYNANADLVNIPNMDGFPNGRRLEDDVVRIELQAVSGAVLAAIGLWYDDFGPDATSGVTAQLGSVLSFTTGIERNDTTLKAGFPYVQAPWAGTKAQPTATSQRGTRGLGLQPVLSAVQNYPNPFTDLTTFKLEIGVKSNLTLIVSDITGKRVATLATGKSFSKGSHELTWRPGREVAPGQYIATVYNGSTMLQSLHIQRN
ncbi:DUF4331 family protein [uncultured Hymenobacter sp.]|uniref:DUF4331 domain-containing protein n=1 Tax=uncultured Hymenobacter sp. TaxID=170016 RepID=UPI0035CC3E6D